ncbi:unnamed protein product [Symbiodinium necroappetens]|uniref:Uncharacterized protein n=1 Tax=Symbiodinium necroappetens TaxID=1628268 RepID=A0A812XNE4_9DINO|nr:unnamed protein product [Symbiodinium necroappetens]
MLTRQVAEVGGWLVKYGSAAALDSALDADPCLCHKYIEQGEVLIQQKKANPTMRLGKHNDLHQRESVDVTEEKRQGLRKPKRKFMQIEVYEKKFGAADPNKIKVQKIDGETIRGVDIIEEDDIGVFEYIDETVNSVQRRTGLSDADVVLSADQNDIIFNATAKHMSIAPKDDASCVLINGITPSSASASATPGAAKDTVVDNDDEDGGSDDETFQPFAALFGRLKTVHQAAKKATTIPKAAGKAAASSTPSCKAKPSKKRAGQPSDAFESIGRAPRGGGAGDLPHAAHVDITPDDQDVVDKYQTRLDDMKVLEAASHDEAAFTQWAKDKVASLQELKQQIYTKKKSLKRRKENTSELASALDGLTADCNKLNDLLKKLSAGTSEGRQLVEMIEGMPDVTPGPAIWMRAIRALAFANLKVMEWQSFFTETYLLCEKHADAGFFSLLASQLLQRMVKAIPCGKALTCDSIATVRAFLDELSAVDNISKTLTADVDLEQHRGLINDLRTVLDFSASPSSVEAAIARAKSHETHWATVAFALPQGKKVMDAAATNAKTKGAASGLLEKIETAENYLDKSGLCCVDAAFMVSMKDAFDAEHAAQICEFLIELAPMKSLKVLKGGDREKWMCVWAKAKAAVFMIVFACASNELLPYLGQLRSSIESKQMLSDPMLEPTCALCHLADNCHGEDVIVGKVKDLSEFVKEMIRLLCDDGPLAEKDANTLISSWASKSTALFACLNECASKAHAQGLDPENKMKECVDKLVAEKEKVSHSLEASLKSHLRDRSLTNIQECMLILRNAVLSAGEVQTTSKDNFDQKVEAALLVSSVLGAEGTVIREGIDAACLLLNCMVAHAAVVHDYDSADQRMAAVVTFLKAYKALPTDNYAVALKEMNKSFSVSCFSEKDYEDMSNFVDAMSAKKDAEFQAIVAYHQGKLEAAYIAEADVEIPDHIAKIEKYSDIKASSVTAAFSMDVTKKLSNNAAELEQAIAAVEEAANAMGIDATEMVELHKYTGSYRSAIRWLLTGNVLYLLVSKAVTRAMVAGSGVHPKASKEMMSCIKTAAEHHIELPQGIHACVTLICGGSTATTQAQPSHAVP